MATTFAPLSWPSCPNLAIIILGRLPSNSANLFANSFAFLNNGSSFISLLYTPDIVLCTALCLPYTSSKASEISPNVALFFAAVTAKSNKFSFPDFAALVIADKDSFTAVLFLFAFNSFNLSI